MCLNVLAYIFIFAVKAGGAFVMLTSGRRGGANSDIYTLTNIPQAQPALGVISNIVFSLSRKKGKPIITPFTEDDFTRRLRVDQ